MQMLTGFSNSLDKPPLQMCRALRSPQYEVCLGCGMAQAKPLEATMAVIFVSRKPSACGLQLCGRLPLSTMVAVAATCQICQQASGIQRSSSFAQLLTYGRSTHFMAAEEELEPETGRWRPETCEQPRRSEQGRCAFHSRRALGSSLTTERLEKGFPRRMGTGHLPNRLEQALPVSMLNDYSLAAAHCSPCLPLRRSTQPDAAAKFWHLGKTSPQHQQTSFCPAQLVFTWQKERRFAGVQEVSPRINFKIHQQEDDASMAWFLFPAWTQLSPGSAGRFTQSDTNSDQHMPVGFHIVRADGCQHSKWSADFLRLVRGTEVLPFCTMKLSR